MVVMQCYTRNDYNTTGERATRDRRVTDGVVDRTRSIDHRSADMDRSRTRIIIHRWTVYSNEKGLK